MRALTQTEQDRMVAEMPTANRAVLRGLRIEWEPASIVFTKPAVVTKTGTTPATDLDPQAVRITYDVRAMIEQGTAGLAPVLMALVDGVKDHPTLSDTDMAEGYVFVYHGDRFRITDTILIPGGIRGIAKAMG